MTAPDDLRALVRAAVWARRPVDGREARSRHRFLVALGRLPRPFDQAADPTHVTGSSLILGPRGVILHRHKRLGLWLQPGGHLEAAETPWDAARREAGEETGLRLDWPGVSGALGAPLTPGAGSAAVPPLAHVDVHDGGRGHTHLDLRYLLAVQGNDEPAPPEGESQDVRWFAWPEAIAVADAGLGGFLRAKAPVALPQ
jgi:8-oxo-dGTP pyrophosphatase MutT (NUDIX family)